MDRRKDNFIEKRDNPGEKVDSCPKEPIPTADYRTDFKGKLEGWAGRDYKQNKTVSFENHLETGHLVVWSASS